MTEKLELGTGTELGGVDGGVVRPVVTGNFTLPEYGQSIPVAEPWVPYSLMLPMVMRHGPNTPRISFLLCRRLSNGDCELEPSGVPILLDVSKVPGFVDMLDSTVANYRTQVGVADDVELIGVNIRTFLRNSHPTISVHLQFRNVAPFGSTGGSDSALYSLFRPLFDMISEATQTVETRAALVESFNAMSERADADFERTVRLEQATLRTADMLVNTQAIANPINVVVDGQVNLKR